MISLVCKVTSANVKKKGLQHKYSMVSCDF